MLSTYKRKQSADNSNQKANASEEVAQPNFRIKRIVQHLVTNRQRVSIITFLLLFALLWLTYNNDTHTPVQQTLALPNATLQSSHRQSAVNPTVNSTTSSQENIKPPQGVYETTPKSLIEANQKAVELALAGQASQATRILEQALLNDSQAGVVFENLRRLYAGFASQSYQLALEPNKPKAITVELASAKRTISVQLDTPKSNTDIAQTTAVAFTAPVTTHVNQPQPVAEAKKETSPAPVEKPLAPSAATPIITPSVNEPTPAQKEAAQRKASQQAIHQALKHWSEAWSKQDVKAYFASYAPSYSPKSTTRKAWMDYRQERILAPKRIKVELSDVKIVLVKPNLAKVSFLQSYTSDTLSARDQKTLELELINNAWLITSESGR